MRHLINLFDVTRGEIDEVFLRARELKQQFEAGRRDPLLAGKVLALIFEKPSLRNRVSFEAAIAQLGGTGLFMAGKEVGLGWRESVADFARVVGQLVDGVVARTYAHELLENLARWSPCPVINALSDFQHPCQALGDLFTLTEIWGSVQGRTLAFVGDGNNVARALAIGCGKLGIKFILAAPPQYQFSGDFQSRLANQVPELVWEQLADPKRAVQKADAIYTDVWASMGQEAESEERRRAFAAFQVNVALMAAAPAQTRFLHCLPAHRGEEVTDEVIDSPRSLVFQQTANGLHLRKALLVRLLGTSKGG
ncbi:MAG: ornithine carbamoyltransferase [Planctomycetes bacterium]|nr:ornithine carbamoyltransferase [Planctomycetota bacterium]